ncbi:VRR-NUC domain-containing protein [Aneurinibacillus aneurinilyticus]|nr:VRR-NUC domain-containing protein [Aneurinibacillus aneurinilyticus]MED0707097.1 VRR-NUC domain-containing protein [Aneurinibacillus aneurinilyticus]MED0732834.1 VRR-NUC domain-containing protein [Aneurinibacillus aneurinilyticus]MED0740396.1 VRR-NUC domain-containing protein [Aneurinibacillus aneurinilyticus]
MYEDDAFKKPSESTLEKKLVLEVEKRGGICWKFTSPGTTGVPDRVVMAPWGRVAFVEMKAPGKKLRALQRKRADQILDLGVPFYCLSSNQDILSFLQEMFDSEI